MAGYYGRKRKNMYGNFAFKKAPTHMGNLDTLSGCIVAFYSYYSICSFFSEYLRAFVILDLPASWCPTFLTLYGIATLAAYFLGDSRFKKVFSVMARFAGLILLPIGILATYTFTLEEPSDLISCILYAQTIHISEVLTGLLTISGACPR